MEVKENTTPDVEPSLSSYDPEWDKPPRKVPAWAIMLAVLSFIIVNAMFLCFAMQMSSNNPG